jgi:hypothetical protein
MLKQILQVIQFSTLLVAFLACGSIETLAAGYTWTDEQGVTHFSDEKPSSMGASEHEESQPARFEKEADKSYEGRYRRICEDPSSLNNVSVSLLEIYIEQVTTLQREVAADASLPHRTRTALLTRIDECVPRLLLAKETAQRREQHQERAQDKLQQKMQRFDKLKIMVAERLDQRRSSSMARGVEGAKFYSDLRKMGDSPLRYGMSRQDVIRLWGEPMSSRMVNTRTGQMDRVSYPLGIDLYFRDGLLETWGWRE